MSDGALKRLVKTRAALLKGVSELGFAGLSPDFSPAKMITYSRSIPVNYSSLCLLGSDAAGKRTQ